MNIPKLIIEKALKENSEGQDYYPYIQCSGNNIIEGFTIAYEKLLEIHNKKKVKATKYSNHKYYKRSACNYLFTPLRKNR